MSSRRRTLQTIQPTANVTQRKLHVSNDGMIKYRKPNAVKILEPSKCSDDTTTQLTRPILKQDQKKSHKTYHNKDTNREEIEIKTRLQETGEKSAVKNADVKLSTVEVPDEPSVLESSDTVDEELFKWMTEEIPPLGYWKELAEQRRVALEETLQENQELYETIDSLNAKIDTLGIKLEAQNKEMVSLNQTVESLNAKVKLQDEEMKTLNVMANEAERLNALLQELIKDEGQVE